MIERLSAVSKRDVPRETLAALERYAALLSKENEQQNLVSASTVAQLWERHISDSAQLLACAPRAGTWCDIGSGAGFPGLVIALISQEHMTLIEPRRLRSDFLERCVSELGLQRVEVKVGKAEAVAGKFDFITARAVASLDRLFAMTIHLAHHQTRWILPKGQSAKSELDEVRRNWQGEFQLVPSQTHEGASIVIADGVRPRRVT